MNQEYEALCSAMRDAYMTFQQQLMGKGIDPAYFTFLIEVQGLSADFQTVLFTIGFDDREE